MVLFPSVDNYESLGHPKEICLLRIPPKGLFGEVRCEIFRRTLQDAPAFEAISYTWSDATKTQKTAASDPDGN
jgi:hypothetical protein